MGVSCEKEAIGEGCYDMAYAKVCWHLSNSDGAHGRKKEKKWDWLTTTLLHSYNGKDDDEKVQLLKLEGGFSLLFVY